MNFSDKSRYLLFSVVNYLYFVLKIFHWKSINTTHTLMTDIKSIHYVNSSYMTSVHVCSINSQYSVYLSCTCIMASLNTCKEEWTLSDKFWLVPSCTTKWIGGSRETVYPALLMTRPSTTNRYLHSNITTPSNHSLHITTPTHTHTCDSIEHTVLLSNTNEIASTSIDIAITFCLHHFSLVQIVCMCESGFLVCVSGLIHLCALMKVTLCH